MDASFLIQIKLWKIRVELL